MRPDRGHVPGEDRRAGQHRGACWPTRSTRTPRRCSRRCRFPTPRIRRTPVEIKGGISKSINPPPVCRFIERCPWAAEVCRQNDHPPLEDKGNGHYVACYLVEQGSQPEAYRRDSSTSVLSTWYLEHIMQRRQLPSASHDRPTVRVAPSVLLHSDCRHFRLPSEHDALPFHLAHERHPHSPQPHLFRPPSRRALLSSGCLFGRRTFFGRRCFYSPLG